MRKSLDIIKEVIEIEQQALGKLLTQQNCDFEALISTIMKTSGRVIVSGIGKSGIIGKKISTTLASTGTPSIFLHPVEAIHGDLGILSPTDLFLLISYSGETEEILRLVPHIKDQGLKIISMTGNPLSKLAQHSDFHVNIHVEKEACPLQLAPTSSTTATLVMGDAIAAALINRRGFKEENFAKLHPGGKLGKMLLTLVKDVMHVPPLPSVLETAELTEVAATISKFSLGVTTVTDSQGKLVGIVTDGDLRRAFEKGPSCFNLKALDLMNKNPKTISSHDSLFEAEKKVSQFKITSLVVVDELKKAVGLLHIHGIKS